MNLCQSQAITKLQTCYINVSPLVPISPSLCLNLSCSLVLSSSAPPIPHTLRYTQQGSLDPITFFDM